MPELPEIKAHAERLTARLHGVELERFAPLSFTALKTAVPDPKGAVGTPLDAVTSRGKYLLLRFGDLSFCVHLMQGGRLEPDAKRSAKPRNGLARWELSGGEALLLTEASKEKKAGVWVLAGEPEGQVPLDRLGPDADTVSVEQLSSLLKAKSMRLHGFLRDQRHVAGLGRRQANEACHTAKLSPFASTTKLSVPEVERLHAAIQAGIAEGLAYERGLDAMSSSKDRPGQVHRRAGEECPVCGDTIRAVEYTAYTVSYCATCQTNGKVLADNTTSKFLK